MCMRTKPSPRILNFVSFCWPRERDESIGDFCHLNYFDNLTQLLCIIASIMDMYVLSTIYNVDTTFLVSTTMMYFI